MDSIEGLALDWMSKVLFWVDAGNRRIEIIKVAGCPFDQPACDRKVLIKNSTTSGSEHVLDRPRAIVVYPKLG